MRYDTTSKGRTIKAVFIFMLLSFLWGCGWGYPKYSLKGEFDEEAYGGMEFILDFHAVYEICNKGDCAFFRFFEDGCAYRSPTYLSAESNIIEYNELNPYLGDGSLYLMGEACYYVVTEKGNIKLETYLGGKGKGYQYTYFKLENGTLIAIGRANRNVSNSFEPCNDKLKKISIEVDSTKAWW